MRSAQLAHSCTAAEASCTGPCPGYGTRSACPPLIVLAVLAAQPTSLKGN